MTNFKCYNLLMVFLMMALKECRAISNDEIEKEAKEEKVIELIESYDEKVIHDDGTVKEISLCSLKPDAPFDGYEFADDGLVISPLKYEHILYAQGGSLDSCWCAGACLPSLDDPDKCDFNGGLKLEFTNYTDFVSVQILNPFSDVLLTAYSADGEIYEEISLKGSLHPNSLVSHAKDIAKVELQATRGPWCMHKLIHYSRVEEKPIALAKPAPLRSQYVDMAIKPRLCPNNLWITGNKRKSSSKIFPVAVLGTRDFNVKSIDFPSVSLQGYQSDYKIYPVGLNYIDVTAPYHRREHACDCTYFPPDGYLDVIFFFNKGDVLKIPAVASARGGDEALLKIRGTFKNSYSYKEIDDSSQESNHKVHNSSFLELLKERENALDEVNPDSNISNNNRKLRIIQSNIRQRRLSNEIDGNVKGVDEEGAISFEKIAKEEEADNSEMGDVSFVFEEGDEVIKPVYYGEDDPLDKEANYGGGNDGGSGVGGRAYYGNGKNREFSTRGKRFHGEDCVSIVKGSY